jgi:quercetin dioxygenase-like cupin family protein
MLSHVVVAGAAAMSAAFATYIAMVGDGGQLVISAAHAQAPANQTAGTRSVELLMQTMTDISREMRISVTERDPGNGGAPHRHPGSHTFGYVLEGIYEVRVDDGPIRQVRAGETFYEPPGSLHAISRNGSTDRPVKNLVIQVTDPTKPRTVPE